MNFSDNPSIQNDFNNEKNNQNQSNNRSQQVLQDHSDQSQFLPKHQKEIRHHQSKTKVSVIKKEPVGPFDFLLQNAYDYFTDDNNDFSCLNVM